MKSIINVLLVLAVVLSFSACTDAPKNDGNAKAGPVVNDVILIDDEPLQKFTSKIKESPIVFSKPGENQGVGSAEEEALKNANLHKPIIYGVGAGGITMDTPFQDSKTLLTPPFRGPFADGLAFYNEQVVVIWQDDGDRLPVLIVPIKGYLGTMDAGKFGQLNFQSKFLDYKGSNPSQGAARLIREFYVEFEKVDPSYDCLATGRCRLIYGTEAQANMVFVLPGAVFLLAKEEFQLAEIRIIRDTFPGFLANNLDLMTGDILVAGQERIKLGESYQTLNEMFATADPSDRPGKPVSYVSIDMIGQSWSGFWYSFHRTNYEKTVRDPEASDVTKTVEVSSEYPAYFTLDGKRILMTQSPGKITFALEDLAAPATAEIDDVVLNATEVESKLRMSAPIIKVNSLIFVKEFAAFLKQQLASQYDTSYARIFGFQDEQKANREIFATVIAYNAADLKGVSIAFRVSEEQERLDFVNVSVVANDFTPFNQVILPMSTKDVERGMVELPVINEVTGKPVIDPQTGKPKTEVKPAPSFTSLVGIELNGLVRLTEVDGLGRNEATVQMVDETLTPLTLKERARYVEIGQFDIPVDNRKKPRDQGFVTLGQFGTELGLVVVGEDDQGKLARIVSIGTSNIQGKIQDFCGLGSAVDLRVGMTDEQALRVFNEALAAKDLADPTFKCDYFVVKDTGAIGRVSEIYFPGDNMKIGFSDRALTSMSIYLPFNQIKELPEVNQ